MFLTLPSSNGIWRGQLSSAISPFNTERGPDFCHPHFFPHRWEFLCALTRFPNAVCFSGSFIQLECCQISSIFTVLLCFSLFTASRNLLVSVITNVFPFLESQTRISSKVQTLDTPRDPWPWGRIFTLWERCRWRIPSAARLLMWDVVAPH